MITKVLRKILITLIIVAPVFTVSDCKKQVKCGCDGDVVLTLNRAQAKVIFDSDGSNITFYLVNDLYSPFYLCNPHEMFPKLSEVNSGDIMLVSGDAFWECNYVYQSSNYSYMSSMRRVYQFQATDIFVDLYGKDKTTPAQ
ncbi:MAG TPA: hypothetical protein VHO46_09765 [Bacteroidales bacterium]|nr:hypothetical protein [Bacteroidales bacterium]